jgi:hypothetical protein
MAQPNIRLSDDAYADLKRLKAALQAEYGLTGRNQDIASALIEGTSVHQAAGMLMAFTRKYADPSAD